jgi:hypothetical protein
LCPCDTDSRPEASCFSQRLSSVRPDWHGQAPLPSRPELEIFPKHFLLHPGEQIHYQVRVREGDHSQSVPLKPGIDRLVEQAKRDRRPVVYWVSKEYPDWYTADHLPDYAFISEGQEHQIHVDAQRVTFAGGDFMFCLLRNAQMTLHGMVAHNAQRIDFIFPAQAIWAADIWGPDEKRRYPAPMVLLTTLFGDRANDTQACSEVVLPFLDRLTMGFPVGGYPPDFPAPLMSDLLKDWTVVVRFVDRVERAYRRADSNKTLLVEFEGV